MLTEPTEINWTNKQIFLSLFWLLLTCLIGFWPLTFGIYSLKNDAIIYFLPVRYAISESIRHFYWPFWTPYFNLGYPLHSDMQAGAWNPFVHFFSLFGTYSLRTLQAETLLYVYLSGVSMLFLLKHFTIRSEISLLIATSYMLCGFNTDSAQFLNWIAGTALLPFAFLFFHRMINYQKKRDAVYSAFFLYLFFVSAYPGEFILLIYFLIGMLLYFLIKKLIQNKTLVRHTLLNLSIMTGVFLILSAPAIFSYLSFFKLGDRGNGISEELALTNSLHPSLLLTYITPLAGWKATFASMTDPLVRNSYVGLITFFIIILGFLCNKNNDSYLKFLKWNFILFLLFSFGQFGFVRKIAFYYLPLMNTFRHPSLARLFTTFCGCLLAACYLKAIFEKQVDLGKLKRSWWALCFFTCVLLIISYFTKDADTEFINVREGTTFKYKIKGLIDQASFSKTLWLTVIIQIPFLVTIYLFFVKRRNLNGLLLSGCCNSVLFCALYQPLSVVKTDTVAFMNNTIGANKINGYPKPDLTNSVNENSTESFKNTLRFGPIAVYSKKIGHSFHILTPSNLKTQSRFWENEKLRQLIFSYPIFYRADTIVNITDTSQMYQTTKKIIIEETVQNLNTDPTNYYTAVVKSFTPNSLMIEVNCNQSGIYCLQQNYHPNWHLLIDGKTQPIQKVNLTFMGFSLEKGKHNIILKYDDKKVRISFMISIILTLLILAFSVKYFFIK